MKPLLIGTGITIVLIIVYVFRSRFIAALSESNSDTTRPSNISVPTELKKNDKLVLIENVSYLELKSVIKGFCNLYNKADYAAQPRLTIISERTFAVTFPHDVEFEIFCFFINYITYPMELKTTLPAVGWTTTPGNDPWITESSALKKEILFIPTNDTEHDNVYMTTSDEIGYKLGFAVGREKQLLDVPEKMYAPPSVTFADLKDKKFEDFD